MVKFLKFVIEALESYLFGSFVSLWITVGQMPFLGPITQI